MGSRWENYGYHYLLLIVNAVVPQALAAVSTRAIDQIPAMSPAPPPQLNHQRML